MTDGRELSLSVSSSQILFSMTKTKMKLEYWQGAQWVVSQVAVYTMDGETDPSEKE